MESDRSGRGLVLPPVQDSDEIINDGTHQWIPIHLLVKIRGNYWTHFLSFDKTCSLVKCKHCGDILKRFDEDNNNEKKISQNLVLLRHLKKNHKIDPSSNFYTNKKNDNNFVMNEDEDDDDELYLNKQSQSQFNSISNDNNFSIDITMPNDMESLRKANEREMFFPTTQLLSIIIASENLPLSFIKNSSVRLLLNKLSDSFTPDATNIIQSIKLTAKQIDSIIERTASRNNVDLQLIIDTNNLSTDDVQRSSQLITKIKSHLIEMNKITFFSLSHSNWNNNSISILSLQFFDQLTNSIKCLPISIDKINSDSDIDKITIRSQLLKSLQKIPNLFKSVISITLPRDNLLNVLHLDDHQFFSQKKNIKNPADYYHNCFITSLTKAIIPLFGEIDYDIPKKEQKSQKKSEKNSNKGIFTTNDDNNNLLDQIIDISNVNISTSIFDKINRFYDEIFNNPWELSRFHDLTNTHLHDSTIDMIYFDTEKFSTAETSLVRFLELRPIIQIMESHINSEKFGDVDFLIVQYLLEIIQSINKIILYFSSKNTFNFVYLLMTVLSIEKHLASTLNGIHLKRLMKPFGMVLENIKEFKQILINDEMVLLAMFLCPAVLFERELLEYAFKSISLSEIVNLVSETILSLLKRFIEVQAIDSSINSNPREMAQNDGGENDNNSNSQQLHNNNNFNINEISDLNYFNSHNPTIQNEVDTLLLQVVQEDLYEYLSTVNSIVPVSYISFCKRSNFVRDNGLFKKRVEVTTNDGMTSYKEEDINYMDQLMDIHLPVCNAFWDQFLQNNAGPVVRLLANIMRTQVSSSVQTEYAFLKNFVPKLGEDFYEDVVKIKLFNSQFSAAKVDFEIDTLPSACQYN